MTLALKRKKQKASNCKNLENEKGKVVPVVIGALGTVKKHFEKWIEKFDLDLAIEALQKPCLLGTERIIRKVLDMK